MEPHFKRKTLSFPHWSGFPPICSPFDLATGLLCILLFISHLHKHLHNCTFLWAVSAGVALPIAAHISDRLVTSRLIQCHWTSAPRFPRIPRQHMPIFAQFRSFLSWWIVLAITMLTFYYYTFCWDPGVPRLVPYIDTHHSSYIRSYLQASRVGEASNPGPEISIATLNVASLCGNQDEISRLYAMPTACVFTETCLTKHILPTVLRKARAANKFVVSGCLCAPRKSAHKSDSISRGESGGVLLHSDMPARAGGTPMDDCAWASTRIMESLLHLGTNFVVRVIGIYGFSKRYPSHIEATNALLFRVLKYVSQSDIPCIFVGDLNCELNELSVWHYLYERGWKDSATLQQQRDGFIPRPTWKSYSRIDFILLPPILVAYFKEYINDPDTVSDHSRISITLAIPDDTPQRRNWKTCRDSRSILETPGWKPTFYEDVDWSSFTRKVQEKDVQGAYRLFCINYEQALEKAHCNLDGKTPFRQFRGRADAKVISQPLHPPLVKPPRHNESDFQVDDAPTALRQRIRQARRVNTVKGQLRCALSSDADQAERAMMAARDTWESVFRAPGFHRGFAAFSHHTLGIPLPAVLYPDHVDLVTLLDVAMASHVQSWKWEHHKLKKHRYKNYMEEDWRKGGKTHFASIRPGPKPEIALLEIPFPMEVIRHKHNKQGPFVLTCLNDIPEGVTFLQFGEARRTIVKKDPPFIHLDTPLSAPRARIQVILLKPTGKLSDIHHMATNYWDGFWNSEDRAEPERLEQVLRDFQPITPFDSAIQLEEVTHALKRIKVEKARGPDSWSPWELKNLPYPFVVALTSLFNLFVEQSEWPTVLTLATVAMLSKHDGTFDVSQTRPITILSMVYRVWSRVVASKYIRHVHLLLPSSIQGNRPGASSKWVASYIQTQVELALMQGLEYSVVSLDLTKAYNLLSRPLLKRLAPAFGVPADISKTYFAFLDKIQRRFRVHGDLSEPLFSGVGVPEGCAFAVYHMLQLNWLIAIEVSRTQTEQLSTSFINYVDNWLFCSYRSNVLHDTLQQVHEASSWCNFRISDSKTWAASSSKVVRAQMKSWKLGHASPQVCEHRLELGMLMKFSRRLSVKQVVPRWEDGIARMSRLLHSSWHVLRKLHVIRRGIFPQIFASCETCHISLSTFKHLRGKLNVIVHGTKTHSSHYLSPLFSFKDDYEPFLYVFKTRLASLRAMILSFDPIVSQLWMSYRDIQLNDHPTKILGPFGCFIWSCQILGWKVTQPLVMETPQGMTMHLLHTPSKVWYLVATQAWTDWILQKAKMSAELRPTTVPYLTYSSLWTHHKMADFPLSRRFRTLGILSGSAKAQIKGQEQVSCEFCQAPEAGQCHLVLRCQKTQHIRNMPKYQPLKHASIFTRCTGIPTGHQLTRHSLEFHPHSFNANQQPVVICTDGSAGPSDLPNIRISTWGVVLANTHGSPFYPLATGVTPGHFHDICRAETFGVLVSLEYNRACQIHCDNQSVVTMFQQLLRTPFDPFLYRAHPNLDLWLRISHLLWTRPPNLVSVSKIKAHRSLNSIVDATQRWLAEGNQRADELAKQTLQDRAQVLCTTNSAWSPQSEKLSLCQSFLATQYLHDVSVELFKIRNEQSDQTSPDPEETRGLQAIAMDDSRYTPRPFPIPEFEGKKWDTRWLTMVCHYFGTIRWPPNGAPGPPISFMEMMVDFLISFQITVPVNKKNLRKKHGRCSFISWDKIKFTNHLPSREETLLLPPPLLTECHSMWMHTIQHLIPLVPLCPYAQVTRRSLSHVGYSNMLPSWPSRPMLLSGDAAQRYLSSLIKPGARQLKYRCLIPKATPKPLPPHILEMFN